MLDPRFSEHQPTVQGVPPTQPRPKKKLSHTVKAQPSQGNDGVFWGFVKRTPLVAVRRRRRK